MKSIFFSILLTLLLPLTLAAQRTITGTVTERSGEPLPGATVAEDGTPNGTTTNAEGKYSLRLTREKAMLVFFLHWI